MTQLRTKLPLLREELDEVARAEDDCKAANVDENDYTVFTCQDLEFELELLEQSITKKIAFIGNQASRSIARAPPLLTVSARLYHGT